MSGSSLDGLDLALCEFVDEKNFTLLKFSSVPYKPEWVLRLRQAQDLQHLELCKLESDYVNYVSSIITDFLEDQSVDYISSHGHTLLHAPGEGYSYQLGEGAYLAGKLSLPVISEFRLQDIAKGGQGAPIAPVVEKYLFQGYDAYLNLGGICNISLHKQEHILAYDVGPCNQLLNALVAELGKIYDENGELASQGTIDSSLLESGLSHSFYSLPAPKSLDNSYVMMEFVQPFLDYPASIPDKLCTAVELISQLICNELSSKARHVFVTGGGAFNTYMMSILQKRLQSNAIELVKPSDEIIEFKEAILMALMGYLRIQNKVNVFSSVTGATSDTIAGSVYR